MTARMPNRPRPRCQECTAAMEPVFAKRERGKTHARIMETFWCRACDILAKGRAKPRYLA